MYDVQYPVCSKRNTVARACRVKVNDKLSDDVNRPLVYKMSLVPLCDKCLGEVFVNSSK